jgi:hypothetical protein
MMRWLKFCFLLLFAFIALNSYGQFSAMRTKTIIAKSRIIQLDTLSIVPQSLIVLCGKNVLLPANYEFDPGTATLSLRSFCSDTLSVSYRVFLVNFTKPLFYRDTTLLFDTKKGDREKYLIAATNDPLELLGTSGLKKSGSISRGISFGNRQDLSVNSTLNLELSGYVSPNLQILASVTDDNLPIQPAGNTNKLQEFDQVFIQLFNEQFKLTAGDFWISKPMGYFMTYKKRGQGLTGEYYWKKDKQSTIKTQVSGALSKGKFNRQIIQGIEGNQGPYRLHGNENEPFIVILSGTERVYIDGKLLERGQEFDYTIDYNTAELIFTARNLITKDVRIVVEFQYSDQNFARSLFQVATSGTGKRLDWWINAYSEQDAKNQPLQQNLSSSQKNLLAVIGDSIQLARSIAIDSIGFSENLVMYQMIDSLGIDSVLVASVNPSFAYYKVNFTYVGSGKGDYVLDAFNALGKVYKWVAPVGGVSVGDYAPYALLITPKQQQLVTAGATYRLNQKLQCTSELGTSNTDVNTYSSLDSANDRGYSLRSKLEYSSPFGKDSIPKWTWKNKAEIEVLSTNFKPIEQYRAVEFDRDWNTRNQSYTGNQQIHSISTSVQHVKFGSIEFNAQHYQIGSQFKGLKSQVIVNWNRNGLRLVADGSALLASSNSRNQFVRHKVDISKQFKKIRIGYKDDQEWNVFQQSNQLLDAKSYSFFDYQGYAVIGDTLKGQFKISYRERLDGKSDSVFLQHAAKAKTMSAEWTKKNWKNQRLLVIANYRVLSILDSTLINQKPENTTNGRIDHDWKLYKSAIQLTTFYEVGAGLEQRKSFIYIKVNDGQGVYTWIDYNGDNIKDLNEFEIAAYADQASYIRVFTPSNEYYKVYSNEFNQSLFIRPERIWSSAKGVKKWLARFSTQSRLRVQRKTSIFDGIQAYNPFYGRIDEASVISSASTMRHTIYFNRTSNVFGLEYSFEQVMSKVLLATGFDGKSNQNHECKLRWNLQKEWSFQASYERGLKTSLVDYTTGRNYRLNYWITKPSLIYQPSTALRLSVDMRLSYKSNAASFGGEAARIKDIGMTAKYNQAKKGSLQGQFSIIQIDFSGNANSPLGFELLEALKPGRNYVWSFGYQRTVSKSLQLSIQYNGRKSETGKFVHAGGMELKAFF